MHAPGELGHHIEGNVIGQVVIGELGFAPGKQFIKLPEKPPLRLGEGSGV